MITCTTPTVDQTRSYLDSLNAAAKSDPAAAAEAIAKMRAIVGAPDPEEKAWDSLTTGARRFYLASANLPEIKCRWTWRDLSPEERTGVRAAIKRAAALAAVVERDMRGAA